MKYSGKKFPKFLDVLNETLISLIIMFSALVITIYMLDSSNYRTIQFLGDVQSSSVNQLLSESTHISVTSTTLLNLNICHFITITTVKHIN